MKPNLRDQLISTGVRSLHEFGYPNCTAENILTDDIYKQCFKMLLTEAKDSPYSWKAVETISALLDEVSK